MKARIVGAVFSVFFVVIAAGCDFSGSVNGVSGADAIEYNERIVNIQSTVIEAMLAMAASFQTTQAASMQRELGKLQRVTDKALVDVAKITPLEGDEGLLKSGTALFKFYKRLAHGEFVTFVKILSKPAPTTEDIAQIERITANIDSEETKLDADFSAAQSRFAKKHNMPLVENKLQKEIDKL
jgi:predicted amino acid-binding ACT domain protein